MILNNSHMTLARLLVIISIFFDRITIETQIVAIYQHDCQRHGYTEFGHHSMDLFATKYAYITILVLCGAKQSSSFACPSSNVVASFKSKAFFPPPKLPHDPLVDEYVYQFHSHDARSTPRKLVLIIQSYCDDDTRYTAARLIQQLIFQV